MEIIHAPRRQGKTTRALEIMRDNPRAIMICMCGARASQISNENKDLKIRVFSAHCYKSKMNHFDEVIIDDGDCIPLSLLLDWINYFQNRNVKLTITTSV